MKDTCGCCEGTEILVPAATANRPGLNALRYRIGTHGSFLETMKARLSSSRYPILKNLTTREGRDASIALLDAWATVADVLTFYQERIANEGYLRTATERGSILELARLIGYRLRPGVAASVFLAFTIENGFDTDIPRGTRVNSKAEQGESSQPFETSDALKARSVWNTLQPRLTQPQFFTYDMINNEGPRMMYLAGTTTNLKPNSPLLLTFSTLDPESQTLEFFRMLYRTLDAIPDQVSKNTQTSILAWNIIPGAQLPPLPADITILLEDIIDRYIAVEDFGLSKTSGVAAKKVVPLLSDPDSKEGLRERVEGNTDLSENLTIMAETIGQLKAILNTLDVRTRRLREWLDHLIAELEILHKAGLIMAAFDKMLSESANDQHILEFLVKAIEELKALHGSLDEWMEIPDAWLSRLIADLEIEADKYRDAQATLARSLRASAATAIPIGSFPVAGNVLGQFPGIFLPPIVAKPPAVPLSSPRQLPRDMGRIFSQRSDLISQMAFTFGGAGEIVYQVWGGSTVPDAKPTPETGILESVEALRVTASLFGHDAPPQPLRNEDQEITGYMEPTVANSWGNLIDGLTDLNIVALDHEYGEIKPGSRIVIHRYLQSDTVQQYRLFHCQVDKVETRSLGIVGTAVSVTVLTLINIVEENDVGTVCNGWVNLNDISSAPTSTLLLRNTRVYAQTDPLTLAEVPITDPIRGEVIELAELYDGLQPGRWLIVSGERTDIEDEFGNVIPGIMASERVLLDQVIQDVQRIDGDMELPGDHPHSFLQISPGLSYAYKPDTVSVYANVVKATHGETFSENLGSGDGSQVFQRFELRQKPLTYVSAPTPDGIESSLVVRVNDVQWREAKTLADLGPKDRGYVTRIADDGTTSVVFGNGKHGARPSTGIENIKGKYRRGIGKAGNARAGQIRLLATKPLHVKSVVNPIRASGGADPETRDQARKNAPLAVSGFDRLVAVKDYEDVACRFAGIGKSSAVSLSDGRRRIVHLTIAGADDIPIDETSDLFLNLRLALQRFGDAYQPVVVAVRALSLLVISAKVQLLADYAWEFVEPKIRAAVLDAFSFERRELGQDVTSSEVISVIQAVEGVSYVDLETLDAVDEQRLRNFLEIENQQTDPDGESPIVEGLDLELKHRLSPDLARYDPRTRRVLPAQIAYLDPALPDTLILTELQA